METYQVDNAAQLTERQTRSRESLLNAGQAEFLENGFEGATLAGVSARAGVSTATLHKYFPTKRALFSGVLARFWAAGGEPPPLSSDTAASLRQLGLNYANRLAAPEMPALIRMLIAEIIRTPELGRELYERGKKPYLLRLEELLSVAAVQGTLQVPDVSIAAHQFFGMINNVVFWPRLLSPGLEPPAFDPERVVNEAVTTFLARYENRKSAQ
jgi:AcrR family transcriptional regulator